MRVFLNILWWFLLWLPLWLFGKKFQRKIRTISGEKDDLLRVVIGDYLENGENKLDCVRSWPLIVVQNTAGKSFGSARYYPPIKCASLFVMYSSNRAVLAKRFENAVDQLIQKINY